MAAVLACGPGAVLSHASAVVLWGLLRPIAGAVDVSVPTTAGRRQRPGIRLHRCRSLVAAMPGDADPAPVTRNRGIPVTTVSRTLADIRGALPSRLERRARRQAEVLGLPLGGGASDRTRSDLESAFLRLCRRDRLPAPEVNAEVAGFTVDFLWRSAELVVETDSYAYHRGRVAFEDDRARDLALRELGFDVIRVADRQLDEESRRVAALVADALHPRLQAP